LPIVLDLLLWQRLLMLWLDHLRLRCTVRLTRQALRLRLGLLYLIRNLDQLWPWAKTSSLSWCDSRVTLLLRLRTEHMRSSMACRLLMLLGC
jgi:hypothetical protein